jgi:hypothetical protein
LVGVLAMTLTGTSPADGWGPTFPLPGAGARQPTALHTSKKARSMKLTAGPRIPTPVSRQGGMPFLASPSQRLLTHSPETKATAPSTVIVFR